MARFVKNPIAITSTTRSLRIASAPWNPVPFTRLELGIFFQFQTPFLATPAVRYPCWLDTGAPLCYLPAHLRQQGLLFHSTGTQVTGLRGNSCEIVTTEISLEDVQGNAQGPFIMLAKLAFAGDGSSPADPILIGLEFLQYHAALLNLDLTAQPRGELIL
jgi:hypothetical protein